MPSLESQLQDQHRVTSSCDDVQTGMTLRLDHSDSSQSSQPDSYLNQLTTMQVLLKRTVEGSWMGQTEWSEIVFLIVPCWKESAHWTYIMNCANLLAGRKVDQTRSCPLIFVFPCSSKQAICVHYSADATFGSACLCQAILCCCTKVSDLPACLVENGNEAR